MSLENFSFRVPFDVFSCDHHLLAEIGAFVISAARLEFSVEWIFLKLSDMNSIQPFLLSDNSIRTQKEKIEFLEQCYLAVNEFKFEFDNETDSNWSDVKIMLD